MATADAIEAFLIERRTAPWAGLDRRGCVFAGFLEFSDAGVSSVVAGLTLAAEDVGRGIGAYPEADFDRPVAEQQRGAALALSGWLGARLLVQIDLPGDVELYRRQQQLQGRDVEDITWTTSLYQLNTWQRYGGDLLVRTTTPVEMWSFHYVIHRLHSGQDAYE